MHAWVRIFGSGPLPDPTGTLLLRCCLRILPLSPRISWRRPPENPVGGPPRHRLRILPLWLLRGNPVGRPPANPIRCPPQRDQPANAVKGPPQRAPPSVRGYPPSLWPGNPVRGPLPGSVGSMRIQIPLRIRRPHAPLAGSQRPARNQLPEVPISRIQLALSKTTRGY